jgi:transposase
MSKPKQLIIKETLSELKNIQKNSTRLIAVRIRALIVMKENEGHGISKRDIAAQIGVNHNSVQTWRTMYEQGGIKMVQSHNKIGFKPSVFTKEEHKAIESKLNDPKNGLQGYVELKAWIEEQFNKQLKYNTVLKYSIKNFGSIDRKNSFGERTLVAIGRRGSVIKFIEVGYFLTCNNCRQYS